MTVPAKKVETIKKCVDIFSFLLEAIPPTIEDLHLGSGLCMYMYVCMFVCMYVCMNYHVRMIGIFTIAYLYMCLYECMYVCGCLMYVRVLMKI